MPGRSNRKQTTMGSNRSRFGGSRIGSRVVRTRSRSRLERRELDFCVGGRCSPVFAPCLSMGQIGCASPSLPNLFHTLCGALAATA